MKRRSRRIQREMDRHPLSLLFVPHTRRSNDTAKRVRNGRLFREIKKLEKELVKKPMFKDAKEGTTHFFNDGCGEPAHNPTARCCDNCKKCPDYGNNHQEFCHDKNCECKAKYRTLGSLDKDGKEEYTVSKLRKV